MTRGTLARGSGERGTRVPFVSFQHELFHGVTVVRALLPVIVSAAFVPDERVILVDSRLSDEQARAAVLEVARTALRGHEDAVAKARRARLDADLVAQVQATAAGLLGLGEAAQRAQADGLPRQRGVA